MDGFDRVWEKFGRSLAGVSGTWKIARGGITKRPPAPRDIPGMPAHPARRPPSPRFPAPATSDSPPRIRRRGGPSPRFGDRGSRGCEQVFQFGECRGPGSEGRWSGKQRRGNGGRGLPPRDPVLSDNDYEYENANWSSRLVITITSADNDISSPRKIFPKPLDTVPCDGVECK